MKIENIHQGTELEKDHNFVVLICDIDDIKSRMKNEGKDATKKELEQIYELAKRRLTDSVMEQFWYSLDAVVDEFEIEKKRNEKTDQ